MKKFIAFLLAAVLGSGIGLLTCAAFEITQVTDETMADTFRKGEHILVDRMLGKAKTFERGDVVLFANAMYMETGEGERMMKRIIGMPGEWVSIKGGIVYIDDEPLDESAYLQRTNGFGDDMTKQFVDAGQYFVLGDNRISSTDSRSETVGLVKAEDIQGKVMKRW